MPASSRSGTRPFSASAPMPPASSRFTSRATRCSAMWWRSCCAALLGLITGALILHTTGVTFLMLTLAIVSVMFEYANKANGLTGGDDGLQGMQVDPLFGVFEFNLFGTDRLRLCAGRAVHLVPDRVAAGAFAVRPLARRHSPEHPPHARDRHAGVVAAARGLHDFGGDGRLGRRAARRIPPASSACRRSACSRRASSPSC